MKLEVNRKIYLDTPTNSWVSHKGEEWMVDDKKSVTDLETGDKTYYFLLRK